MTIPPPSTTSSSGILRSQPRYTSSSTNDGNVVADTSYSGTKVMSDNISANKIESVVKGESIAKDNNKPTTIRTLSDLVQSSINLSSEVHGTKDISERGNVISHRPKNSTSQLQQNDDGKVKENSNSKTVESKVPTTTLFVSKDGKPYLSDTPVNDIADIKERSQDMSSIGGDISSANQQQQATSSGPQVVDIMGIMDNDTKNVVRFCELNDEHDDNNGSSRDRLEQRIQYENDIEDVNMDDNSLNKGGYDDEDASCSSGSDQDDEILKELGLHELIEEEANDNDDEGMDNEDIGMNSESMPEESTNIRTFRTFWELLTRWATSSTVDLILSYQGVRPTPDDDLHVATISSQHHGSAVEESKLDDSQQEQRCDVNIGASRQQAIMSMIKMCLGRSLSELNKISTVQDEHGIKVDQRRVEQRLADLVRTFDTSTGGTDLNMKMWKGLTTLLIRNVFPHNTGTENSKELPKSIQALNISVEEYQYLTRSVFTSLKGMS